MSANESPSVPTNFIRNIIDAELAAGTHRTIVTRFPPEPNGYLHIGHAKAICLNFGLAAAYGGRCHLRMDDTNPEKESMEYADSIQDVVRWLGFDWGEHLYFASDYYERLYQWAEELIRRGAAYVDSLTPEEMRAYRGTLTEAGRESSDRNRPADESLALFRRMRAGAFADGALTLRARIDMASPNINLRDPVIYRIQRHHHYRTGDAWCIYPMYDYAHPLSDAIEGITHSICTLEFEDHRPLYDWFLEQLADLLPARPRQIEFARLNLSYTLMSKRRLLELVREKRVAGWDDPRMPTLFGLRRRGFTAAAIRTFCERIGVGKSDSWIDMSVLEDCVREDLNVVAPRALAVFHPLKIVLTDYPAEREEFFEAPNHPQQPEAGSRQVPFCREIYIDRDDFMEDPPKKFFRLAPGREVRLRFGYIIRCDEVVKDPATGEVIELRCSHDPSTLGANPADGRKVKGTIHWVSARHAARAEVRLYDRLFAVPTPGSVREGRDWREDLNPESLQVHQVLVEPGLLNLSAGRHVQFERIGYFFTDPVDSRPGSPVFNRTVGLRDSWTKPEGGA